jgi:two-component system sensor histidine kinase KdpD
MAMPGWAPLRGFLMAIGFVLAATGFAAAMLRFTPLDSVSAIFMLPVLVAAVRYGTGPAVMAALLGALMTTLLYPPVFRVLVFTPSRVIDLVTSLLVALTVGQLAGRLRRHMVAARAREQHIRQVYALSDAIASARDVDAVLAILAEHLATNLDRPIALFAEAEGRTGVVSSAFAPAVTERLSQAAETFLRREPDATGDIELPGIGRWLLCRATSGSDFSLVLAIELPTQDPSGGVRLGELARSLLSEAATSLERLGVRKVLDERRLRQRTDELRDILVEAVSHELRTPLAGITGSASVLAHVPHIEERPQLRELATGIETEARRLDRLIQDVLDLGRIRAGALQPRLQETDPVDVVNDALMTVAERLAGHPLRRRFDQGLPLIRIDPVLLAQALVNILENAGKYTPPGGAIEVAIRRDGEELAIEIADAGHGLEAGEAELVFERFQRGRRYADVAGGSGLGLTIARVFVEANGGRVTAISEGPGRGTTMRITLPVSEATGDDEDHD